MHSNVGLYKLQYFIEFNIYWLNFEGLEMSKLINIWVWVVYFYTVYNETSAGERRHKTREIKRGEGGGGKLVKRTTSYRHTSSHILISNSKYVKVAKTTLYVYKTSWSARRCPGYSKLLTPFTRAWSLMIILAEVEI